MPLSLKDDLKDYLEAIPVGKLDLKQARQLEAYLRAEERAPEQERRPDLAKRLSQVGRQLARREMQNEAEGRRRPSKSQAFEPTPEFKDHCALIAALAEAAGIDLPDELTRHDDDEAATCACWICRCDAGGKELYRRIEMTRAWGTPEEQKARREDWLKSGEIAGKLKVKAQEAARILAEFNEMLAPGTPTRMAVEGVLYGRASGHWERIAAAILDVRTSFTDSIETAEEIAQIVDYSDEIKRLPAETKQAWGVESRPGRPRKDFGADRLFYHTARVYHEVTGLSPMGIGTDDGRSAGPLWRLCERVWKVCWPNTHDGASERFAGRAAQQFVDHHSQALEIGLSREERYLIFNCNCDCPPG